MYSESNGVPRREKKIVSGSARQLSTNGKNRRLQFDKKLLLPFSYESADEFYSFSIEFL